MEGKEDFTAQVTRNEAEQLGLEEGVAVWVRTTGRTAVPVSA